MGRIKNIKAIKKRARGVFSKLIRLKNSVNGNCTCVSCGAVLPLKKVHAGHYIHERLATLFDERNVNPQCAKCNLWGHGNLAEYAIYLEAHYGEGILQELHHKKNENVKYSYSDYQDMIAKWKDEIKDLEIGLQIQREFLL